MIHHYLIRALFFLVAGAGALPIRCADGDYTTPIGPLFIFQPRPELNNDHDEQSTIEDAINYMMTNENPLLNGVRALILQLGNSFERLWHTITGQAEDLPSAPGGLRPNDPRDASDGTINVGPDLQAIHEDLKNLHAFGAHTYQTFNTHLDGMELHTLSIMNAYSKRALIIDGALGSTGFSALYAIYGNDWPSLFSRAHARFITGLEIPAALAALKGAASATTILAGPLVKPVLFLIVGSVCWSRFKRAIQLPLIMKHKDDIQKFKDALATHEQKTNAALEKQTHSNLVNHQKIEGDLKDIKRDFQAELQQERDKNKRLLEAHTNQMQKLVHTIETAQHEDASALKGQLLQITREFQTQLHGLEADVTHTKQLGQEQKEKLGVAMSKLDTTHELARQLVVTSERQVQFIRDQAPRALPAPQQQERAGKKHWWKRG